MLKPQKHPRSGVYRLRLFVPASLHDAALRLYGVKRELIANLKTKDLREAKRRAPAAEMELRGKLDVLQRTAQGSSVELSERDIAALAGVVYQRELETYGNNPGNPEGWQDGVLDPLLDQLDEHGALQLGQDDLDASAKLLAEHNYPADTANVRRLAEAVWRAQLDAARALLRRAEGDWREEPSRYPKWSPSDGTRGSTPTLDTLLTGWAADRGWSPTQAVKPPSLYDRCRIVERLAGHLGHRDVARVGKPEATAWKAAMQSQSLAVGTIRNNLFGCRSLWAWAVRHGLIQENPFADVLPPKGRPSVAVRPFSEKEVGLVLNHARGNRGFMRWGVWLLTVTGARIGEIAQLTVEDVVEIEGTWCIRIHEDPTADGTTRSLKTIASKRVVPIHSKLLAEGFLDFVRGIGTGSLWKELTPALRTASRAIPASRHMGRWVRKIGLTDTRLHPAHSLRHRFIDAARAVAMHPEIRSALTGHSARRDESAAYGAGMGSMVKLLATAVETMPVPVPTGSPQRTTRLAVGVGQEPPGTPG